MFYFIYNAILSILWPVYVLCSILMPGLREFRRSRITLDDFPALNPQGAPLLWLHAASVGEMDQALAVAREFRPLHPKVRIALSVFSLSVKKLEHSDVDVMFRLPVDFYWSWAKLLRALKPGAFVTFTWDVFPNLLLHLKKNQTPAFLSCAALAADSSRLRFPLRPLMKPVYRKLSGIGVVDQNNLERFQILASAEDRQQDQSKANQRSRDWPRVMVTGDSRYDAIFHRIENAKLSDEIERKLKSSSRNWILASTYAACDDVILPHLKAILDEFRDLNVLVFPHFVDEKRIQSIEAKIREQSLSYTRFSDSTPGRICIVDQLGVLALAYRYAAFAYVGGGFHHRIHNTGEPAAFALPILTGPRIETSPVALLLEEKGALSRIDSQTIVDRVRVLMKDDAQRVATGRRGQQALQNERGSAKKFVAAFLSAVFAEQPRR
ncbi:MAG: hypothetical protein JNM27_04120 [Leptospirales bacterium]|nr:hypothetical protein [Leptospirales bacterium]